MVQKKINRGVEAVSFLLSLSSFISVRCTALEDIDTGVNKLGPILADTHLTKLVSDLDRVIQILAKRQGAQEATGKHVAGTVGVDDLVVCQLGDGVRLGVGVRGLDVAGGSGRGGGGDEGGVGTLGDDDETGSGGVGFGEGGEGGGDVGEGGVLG